MARSLMEGFVLHEIGHAKPKLTMEWNARILAKSNTGNTMKTITMTLAMAAFFVISARGQGFLNLDFESAYNMPGNPGNGTLVPVTNALPDWTAYGGYVALANIYYVSNILGHAQAAELESGSLALSGNNFSVGLYPDSSISQTGLVPSDAESLQFEANSLYVVLNVALGGQRLSYSPISEGPGYVVFGADIPAGMDGQTEALTFSSQSAAGALLDNIEFSSMGVPEPSEYALVGLGAVLFGFWRPRKTAAEG
jgi:hypothetical protein